MNEQDKAFFRDGYLLGIEIQNPSENKEDLYRAVSVMYDQVDGLIGSFLDFARQNDKPAHCGKGCQWCCYQPVFAMSWEMDYLNNYILNNFKPEEREKVKTKAEEKNNILGNLQGNALLNAKSACPLLAEGSCSAYSARPMACRIYLSTSLDSCLRFYHHAENESEFPELLEFILRAGRWMNEGFKAALKMNGYKIEESRIEENLLK